MELSPLWISVKEFLTRFTSPSPAIQDKGQRQQARILSIISIALFFVQLLITPIWLANVRDPVWWFGMTVALLGAVAVVYVLSRTERYRLAAVVLVLVLQLYFAFALVRAQNDDFQLAVLKFFSIPVMLSVIFLPGWFSVVSISISLILIGLYLADARAAFPILYADLLFFSIMVVLTLAIRMIQNHYYQLLIRSEDGRYQDLFDQMHDAVFIIGLDGTHLDVNRRASEMLGYTVNELKKMNIRQISAEVDQSSDVMTRLLRGESIAPYERVFRKKDGSYLPVDINAQIVYFPDGRPRHVQSLVRDITHRKQSESSQKAFLDDMRALQKVNLDLSSIDEIETLYQQMISVAHSQLGFDRIGLFVLTDDGHYLRGTFGVNPEGELRDETYYREQIGADHWTLQIIGATDRVNLWKNASIFDNGIAIGTGWKAASALWNGQTAIGYLVIDNFVSQREVRPYETELLSLLGSAYGHLIERKQMEGQLRQSSRSLHEQSSFLRMLLDLSSRFINLPVDNLDTEIGDTLQEIGTFLNMDRVYLFDYDFERQISINTYEWCAEGIEPQIMELQEVPVIEIDDWTLNHRAGKPMYVPDVQALDHSSVLYQILNPQSIQSLLTIPMMDGDEAIGFVGLDAVREKHVFTEPEQQLLTVFSQMLVNVRNRIKTLRTVRENEMRQRALLSAIPDLVFRLDREGIYLDYHASNPDDLVVPPEQFLGHKGSAFLPADIASAHQSNIEQVFQTDGEAVYEYSALIHGQMNDYEARMVRAGENEVLTIVRNVTERKRMEVALRQSEARMRSIMGNMRDSVWAIDLIGNRETYYNPVTEQIYGRPVTDFYENPDLWREMIHPDDREIMMNSHAMVIEHGFAEWEYRIIRPDGSVRWLHDRSWGVYNEYGVAIRLEGIASDVTERRQSQHREVELRLEKERRQLLTVFFQNAAHEFRTPLTIIGSSTYLMTRVENDDRRRSAAAQINLQIERITRLVDMLQLMTGLESTQVHLDTRVNIGGIVQTLSAQLGEMYRTTHETNCQVPHDLPAITGNHSMLTVAFRQILENAYRFTPEHGKVTVLSGATDSQIWIEIADTGTGIASEDLPMIFDTFWRRDVAHSTPGFGLGLSIARKVIEEHGGWIAVDSTEGKGSRFRVYLPIRIPDSVLIEPVVS